MQAPKVIRRSPVVFALAVLAAMAMLFISEGSYLQAVNSLDGMGTMAVASMNIQRLERNVLEAESSRSGFLLTGQPAYLDHYAEALQSIEASFKALAREYDDEDSARAMLARLRSLTESRLSIIAETIRLQREGRAESARELVLSGLGREKMQDIREVSAELLAYEMQKLAKGRASMYRTLLINRIGVALLSAAMLLALYMYLRHGTTLEAHRQELKSVAEAEHEQLEVEVRQRTAQLTDLTRHLLSAREDERDRLARDLHDELGSLLTSAKLDAARIKSRLAGTAPEALERLAHLVDTLNSAIALGRRIIEDLRPSTLANLGLVEALQILAREFGASSGIEVHCALAPVRLSASAELVVYRLVQEAFTNLGKYAQARQAWVTLAARDGQVQASVRDDGVGFDAGIAPTSAYGLLGMHYRAEAEQGTLTVESAPGQGTTVQLTLPQSS